MASFARLTLLLSTLGLVSDAAAVYPSSIKAGIQSATDEFAEFNQSFSKLQSRYWQQNAPKNGSWPSGIPWTQAFTTQLTAASLNTYLQGVTDFKDVPASVLDSVKQSYAKLPSFFFNQDVYYNYFLSANDDLGWVTLSWLEAYQAATNLQKLDTSVVGKDDLPMYNLRAYLFYDKVASQWDTSTCGGGVTWSPTAEKYKNSITNQLFLATTMNMYLYSPGYLHHSMGLPNGKTIKMSWFTAHPKFLLDRAKEIYAWLMSSHMTNDQGLFIDGYHLTGKLCDKPEPSIWSYNQGVILDGMRGLFDATGDSKYLHDGYTLINNVVAATGYESGSNSWSGLGSGGIMQDSCDRDGSCAQDRQNFKGIFWLNFAKFCEAMSSTEARVRKATKIPSEKVAELHNNTCRSYLPWVRLNAQAALASMSDDGLYGMNWAPADVKENKRDMAAVDKSAPSGPRIVRLWANSAGYDADASKSRAPNTDALLSASDSPQAVKVNDQGRGRTLETQNGGLAILRAYYQMVHL